MALPDSSVYSEAAQRGTPTPTGTETASQTDADAPLFGPTTGDLALPLDFVETGLKVRDFKLKMRFYNLYELADGNWLLAILFHTKGREAASGFVMGISVSGEWALSNFLAANQQVTVDNGQLPQMKTGKGTFNDIELTVDGTDGLLVMNGEEVTSLNLFDFNFDNEDADLLVGVFGNVRNVTAHYEDLTVTNLGDSPSVNLTRTPNASIPCVVTTTRATPLLAQPDQAAPRVISIPAQKQLEGSGLSEDLLWIKVSYGGQIGWVIRFSAELGNGCADLPIANP